MKTKACKAFLLGTALGMSIGVEASTYLETFENMDLDSIHFQGAWMVSPAWTSVAQVAQDTSPDQDWAGQALRFTPTNGSFRVENRLYAFRLRIVIHMFGMEFPVLVFILLFSIPHTCFTPAAWYWVPEILFSCYGSDLTWTALLRRNGPRLPVFSAGSRKIVQFLKLSTPYSSLNICYFQIVPDMRIHILMIISEW